MIPCNTASTLALADLRDAYPGTPFVGTVPAIKPAAERTRSGLVSVLATPGTVKRAYTRDLIQSFAEPCHVRLVGSQNLARMAEAYIRGEARRGGRSLAEIAPCFVEMDGQRTDIVVLACTHYPFLANIFRRLAPWPVDWLDPAEAIARRAPSLAVNCRPARTARPGRRRLHLRQARFRHPPADAGFWALSVVRRLTEHQAALRERFLCVIVEPRSRPCPPPRKPNRKRPGRPSRSNAAKPGKAS